MFCKNYLKITMKKYENSNSIQFVIENNIKNNNYILFRLVQYISFNAYIMK